VTRLTTHWTPTLGEAFGKTGSHGADGEEWLADRLTDCGVGVQRFISEKEEQIAGIDIIINNVGIDIKNNVNDENQLYVEVKANGWLLNSKKTSPIIWHTNPRNGKTYWYRRCDMIEFVRKYPSKWDLKKIYDPTKINFINEVIFDEESKVYLGHLPEGRDPLLS